MKSVKVLKLFATETGTPQLVVILCGERSPNLSDITWKQAAKLSENLETIRSGQPDQVKVVPFTAGVGWVATSQSPEAGMVLAWLLFVAHLKD